MIFYSNETNYTPWRVDGRVSYSVYFNITLWNSIDISSNRNEIQNFSAKSFGVEFFLVSSFSQRVMKQFHYFIQFGQITPTEELLGKFIFCIYYPQNTLLKDLAGKFCILFLKPKITILFQNIMLKYTKYETLPATL